MSSWKQSSAHSEGTLQFYSHLVPLILGPLKKQLNISMNKPTSSLVLQHSVVYTGKCQQPSDVM